MKIPMPDYVAVNNPHAVIAILRDFNIPAPTGPKDLIIKTRHAVSKYKEDVIHRLIEAHPDRELFEFKDEPKETKSNCSGGCGCGGVKPAMSNCSGCEEKKSNFVIDESISATNTTGNTGIANPVMITKNSALKLEKNVYVPALVFVAASLIAFKLLLK
jgi:hypothetical protein